MQFRCLGSLSVIDDGRHVALGGPKQRLVLATLLLHLNQEVTADRLVTAVWDGDVPASGRNSLHTYVSHLRKALGAERIERRGQSYTLRAEPDEIDRDRFEGLVEQARALRRTDPVAAAAALREALGLWTGPAFADLADAASLQAEITRLEQLRLAAVEERISIDLDRGLSLELISELEALVASHPLRERLWAALMLALYRAGRQGEALAAYERARAVLVEELGVDPSPELRRLHEQVLHQDPSLEPGVPALKGYRLMERLAEDPVWTTWRATQPGVERDVAVRIARPEVANSPSFIRRFDVRAQRIASIEHPHVLPIYDFWREPDGAYIVTRLATGGDLAALLSGEAPDPQRRRRRIADQVLRGAAAAHRHGVVHGRISPRAVVLDQQGNAFLTDFAVVEPGDRAARPATDGRRFVAPELVDGAPADTRADVYSLGVLLSEVLHGAHHQIHDVLARASAVDPLRRPADAESMLAALQAAWTVADGPTAGSASIQATQTLTGRNPYKGLRAFTEADSDDFFGRETVVARLVGALRDGDDGRFLAVVGPSGGGKSSVVRAGLVPALRAGAVPGSADWYIVQMVPGTDPFEELAAALRTVAVDPPAWLPGALAGVGGIAGTVDDVLPDDGELLVVIDQFEELYTLVDAPVRRRFVDVLVAAVTAADRRILVVVTLRADFYDRPLADLALAELVQAHTETVVPMAATELEAAVTRPAERVGAVVEGALVAEMISEVADQPGALPLLQYALTEVFDVQTDGRLTVDAYRRIGGVTGALSRRADTVYTGLPDAPRRAAQQLFLRLVTPGEGVEDTRRRATVAEVTALAADAVPTVLRAFGDARLLSFDRDPDTRQPTVEVAHEALLREWGRLRGWIDAARDDLRIQRRLRAAASDWEAAGRDASFLATGSRLDQYEAWRADSGMTPAAAEAAYLDASVEHRDRLRAEEEARRLRERALERRSGRRLRVLVSVLAAAAVIGGALTVLAVSQANRAADQAEVAAEQADIAEVQANVASVRELAAASVAHLDSDPELSMLLALEAVDRTRSVDDTVLPEAEEALHRAVTSSRIEMRVPGIGGSVAWSPVTDEFVTEGPEETGLVDIRDGATGATVRSWEGHSIDINDVAYSPDGSVLVTAGDDGAVRAWDAATGEQLGSFSTLPDDAGEDFVPGSDVWGPSVSPDNTLMAAAWPGQGLARVIDIASGEVILETVIREVPLDTAFHPDGTLFAISERLAPGGAAVMDLETGEQVWAFEWEHPVYGLNFSPDGRWLATWGPPAELRLFDARSGDLHSTVTGHDAPLEVAAWSADGGKLATGGQDGMAKVWEVRDGRAHDLMSLSSRDTTGAIVGLAFSPDADRLLMGPGLVTAAVVWDISLSGDAEWANMPAEFRSFSLAALPGGRVIASGPDAAATLWDARTGEHLRRFDPGAAPVRHLAATPDGAYVAGETWEGLVHVWDVNSGHRRWSVGDEGVLVSHLDFAADPYRLAVMDEFAVIHVYDESGTLVQTLEEDVDRGAGPLAFSPDGRFLAAGSYPPARNTEDDHYVVVWDVAAGEVVQKLHRGTPLQRFSPDGQRLLTAAENIATIWDVDDGTQITTLVGHEGILMGAAFDPSGEEVATAGGDGTVRLWNPDTGIQRLALRGHDVQVHSVVYSDDGSMLISADHDGVVRSWATDIDDLVAIARAEVARDLTTEECRQYLHVESCPSGRPAE